jgi:hypothetical protein
MAGLAGTELLKQELLNSLNHYNGVLDNHLATTTARVEAQTVTARMILFRRYVQKHKENVTGMINIVQPMPHASIYSVLLPFRQRLMALITDMDTQQTE